MGWDPLHRRSDARDSYWQPYSKRQLDPLALRKDVLKGRQCQKVQVVSEVVAVHAREQEVLARADCHLHLCWSVSVGSGQELRLLRRSSTRCSS